jgi:dTDP-4-amino-4,6-dideoxygalactose transaminase
MSELAILGGTPVRTKPFPAWPIWDDKDIEAITRALNGGKWGIASPEDSEVARFESTYAAYHGAKHGVCVHSGTTAIRVALQALGAGYGDEIIVPAYTFVGTVSPIIDVGAVPIFVDIDPDTYTIDPVAVEAAITPHTVGIVPVHFAGMPANMDALLEIATRRNLWIMEDAAQAWGAQWNGVGVGHIGAAGIFSFQSSKNVNAGEGGIILTDDDSICELLRSYSNCGRSSTGVWYGHFRVAGNYRMSQILAALLYCQFARYPEQHAKREANAAYLAQQLAEVPGFTPLTRPTQVTRHAQHLFIWRYNPEEFGGLSRTRFIEAMHKEGIPVSPGYAVPLYQQPVFLEKSFDPKHAAQRVDFGSCSCPASERACSAEALWLTQPVMLGEKSDMDDIVAAALKVRKNSGELIG